MKRLIAVCCAGLLAAALHSTYPPTDQLALTDTHECAPVPTVQSPVHATLPMIVMSDIVLVSSYAEPLQSTKHSTHVSREPTLPAPDIRRAPAPAASLVACARLYRGKALDPSG